MKSFLIALCLICSLPAIAADKTFRATWAPTVNATSVRIVWVHNGSAKPAVILAADAVESQITLPVDNGQSITIQVTAINDVGNGPIASKTFVVSGLPTVPAAVANLAVEMLP